jgi:hypothetical protein
MTEGGVNAAMSIWIAKFLGPVMLAVAVPMIATPVRLLETSKRFLADSPLVLISGVLAMMAGLSIVNTHNTWKWNWTVIITLFGWALVLSGVSRIVAPAVVDKVGSSMMDRPVATRVVGALWALLGAFLTLKGYM